ncbi:hypothetical protein [Pseudomonas sp. Z4-20]|uniref:hypothetical protein n=1 Tax=Pseudomonas sp. Z4-20 TaxID=2817414 RepID=UPI003DAA3A1F
MLNRLVKKIGVDLLTTLIAAFALLGPALYVMAACFEFGRLSYYRAPVGFIQFGSIGIFDVLSGSGSYAIYGLMIFFGFVFLLAARGRRRIVVASALVSMNAILMLSNTSQIKWQIFLGLTTLVGFLVALFGNAMPGDHAVLSEDDAAAEAPITEVSIANLVMKILSVVAALIAWGFVLVSAGTSSAERQRIYWANGEELVLGFYGESVLTTSYINGEFGQSFKIQKLDEFSKQGLRQKKFGYMSAPKD